MLNYYSLQNCYYKQNKGCYGELVSKWVCRNDI